MTYPTFEEDPAGSPSRTESSAFSVGSKLAGCAMDPRKLVYLATIVEQGSLAKAAKVLEVSQPALSKSMDRLELELGMKVLERTPAGIALTRLGELIYSHARSIRDEMDLAKRRLKGADGAAPVLTLGTLPSLASSVVPLAVSRWRAQHPNVLLRVVEKVQAELLLGLLLCRFDMILAQTEFFDFCLDGLKQRVLFRDRLCVFANPKHRLFSVPELSWAEVAKAPWVCPMVGWSHRTILEKTLAAEGVPPPEQMVECGSIDFTKSLVATSDHLAMLPVHCVMSEVAEGTIQRLPITVSALKRDIAVIFREGAPLSTIGQDLIAQISAIGSDADAASDRI